MFSEFAEMFLLQQAIFQPQSFQLYHMYHLDYYLQRIMFVVMVSSTLDIIIIFDSALLSKISPLTVGLTQKEVILTHKLMGV
jgi:hypothetical protein